MSSVIAFEGPWPEGARLAWGVAAIKDDRGIFNAVTKHRYSGSFLPSSPSNGESYTLLPVSIDLRDDYANDPVVVIGFELETVTGDFFRVDTRGLGGLIGKRRSKGRFFLAFRGAREFQGYVDEVVKSIFMHLLQGTSSPDESRTLIHDSLTVAPKHPGIHAIRVHLAENKARTKAFARTMIGDDKGITAFEEMLSAFQCDQSMWLVYEGGVAEGGGLPIDVLSRVLAAAESVDRNLCSEVIARLPMLDPTTTLPHLHFREAKVGSAHLSFAIKTKDSTLLDQLLRFTQLKVLEEVLRGNIPASSATDPSFLSNLAILANPADDTSLSQQPLGSDSLEPVVVEMPGRRELKPVSEPFTVLGYLLGSSVPRGRVDVQFAPGVRESLSTIENGTGATPDGASIFRDRHDFLYRPTLVTVRRFVDGKGHAKQYLQAVKILEKGCSAAIDAIMSNVVSGAFVLDAKMWVHLTSDGELHIQNEWAEPFNFATPTLPMNMDVAGKWLEDFHRASLRSELFHFANGRCLYLAPNRFRHSLSLLHRILLALEEVGGDALVTDILGRVHELGRGQTRRISPWSSIHSRTDLIEEDADDPDRVRLTQLGAKFARIILAMYGMSEGL